MHKIILPLILVAIVILGFFVAKDALSRVGVNKSPINSGAVVEKDICGSDCKSEIADQVARAIATLSASPTVIVQNKIAGSSATPVVTPKPQDSYIQISGNGSTTNTNWTDVVGSDFSFDVSKDFGVGAKFAWEGFLRVANANGQAFARIYDATHNIGVDGSQISITNSADYVRAVSTNLNFWSGRNVYRIQIKSLNTLNVDYMGGKVRVSYQ